MAKTTEWAGSGAHEWPFQRLRLEYFRPDNTADNWDRPERMNRDLLLMLEAARAEAGVPFVITSGYRYDDKRSHGRGRGVDIRCRDSMTRFRMVSALLNAGFTRMGIYDLHIHVDNDPSLPPNVVWVGKSE